MTFSVRYSTVARGDLIRLYGHLLERAKTVDAITDGVDRLPVFPFGIRKAGASPFLRELLIPFGAAGYVALFEIQDTSTVTILAVRHQLPDNYH